MPNRIFSRQKWFYISRLVMLWCGIATFGFVIPFLQAQETPPISARDLFDKMTRNTVRIASLVENADTGDVLRQDNGSGYVIADRYIVTNSHVVPDKAFLLRITQDELTKQEYETANLTYKYTIQLKGEQEIPAEVVWRSDKDFAILKIDQKLPNHPRPLVSDQEVYQGMDVYSLGFPDDADEGVQGDDYYKPTLTRGTLGRVIQGQRVLLQIDAAINPGSSGGPLYNSCGELVGINAEKALTRILDADGVPIRISQAEGVGFAISVKELTEGLKAVKIPFILATQPCFGIANFPQNNVNSDKNVSNVPTWMWILLIAVIVFGVGAVYVLTREPKELKPRTSFQNKGRGITQNMPKLKRVGEFIPILQGIQGYFADTTIELSDAPFALGRDPEMCQLVFPNDKTEISKRHCLLTYDPEEQVFYLEDCWSKNGTFTVKGGKINSGDQVVLQEGDRFYLGDVFNEFEVQLEEISDDIEGKE